MDVWIVVYAPRVYLNELTFTCFSLWTNYYHVIESIDKFYFVNNVVVYKAVLVQGKGGKLVYEMFIVNVTTYY